jgi:branched-chain amino acid transport system substrate-binding protein
MTIARTSAGRAIVATMALILVVAACGGGATPSAGTETAAPATSGPATAAPAETEAAANTDPVAVCELAYYTGEFAAYGESLTNDVVFPVMNVINLDPPLGRTWEMYHEDLGTVGEAQAARTCLEQHGAEVVVSIAHGYRTYRDFMMETWAEKDSPIGPSVHGGAIPGNLGGKGAEPIFRAQGLDEALGTSGSLYADSIGAKNVVVFATQVEGFQLAADAAEKAAEALGLNVLARIDSPAEQPSYRAEAQKIAELKPDAVIVQAGSVESATLIKQAAEAGLSLNWIGETGWILQEFIKTLGTEPIASQKGIGFAAFSPNTSTPAWEFYQPLWDKVNGDKFGPASDQYHFSTYDLMVQTALAVEAAGSYKASEWAPAMHEVGEGGEKCYTYADCLALIRAGTDVDYEGITGPGLYTDGGVNAVNPSYTPFNADGTPGEAILLDAAKSLELIDSIKTVAECDAPEPPNSCEW